MAPLVLHNVPDDELYTGKDGVTRPFAVVGAADERRSMRLRRQASTNHGPFGRARSRGRAGSVGPGSRRAQQQAKATSTTSAADEVFSGWKKQYINTEEPDDAEETDGAQPQTQTQPATTTTTKNQNQPIEIILRGYRSPDYQYAAVNHYEQIAGRICEDYPRDPPVGSRRYRSGLRDAAARAAATVASNGTAALTPAERQAVMQRAASGQHWVKVTFESIQAAEAALYASPQSILGYWVAAEPYRGVPLSPSDDVAVPDEDAMHDRSFEASGFGASPGRGGPGGSPLSSHTVESGTVTNDEGALGGTKGSPSSSSGTMTGMGFSSSSRRRVVPGGPASWSMFGSVAGSQAGDASASGAVAASGSASGAATPSKEKQNPLGLSTATSSDNPAFCRTIPTAKKATLRSADLALLPRESTMRQVVKKIPLLHRLTGTVIGNQVPRKDNGLFDWDKASLYWKLIWWLDFLFCLFGGEILDANKDE